MKPNHYIQRLLATLFLTAAAFATHAAPLSVVPPTESYAGKTHAQWLESWFTWIFSVPGKAADFPFRDSTGANSGVNQNGPVFFLAKSWLGKKGNPPEQRSARVPEGTAIFIPFDGIFSPNPNRDPATLAVENREALQDWVPFVFKLLVDGEEIPIDSSLTSPFLHETSVFSLSVPANAAARTPEAGFEGLPEEVHPFHSLEWFALLKPLPVGQHIVHVYGSDSVGTDHEWVTDVVWTINVVPQTSKNPPVITRNPMELQRSLGDSAVFTVTATGTAPLSYQWRKDDVLLADKTSAVLTLTNLTTGAAGSYSVVISNSDGSVTSSAALLTIDTLFTVNTESPVANGNSTGTSWGDYDNDGLIDLATVGVSGMQLYRNTGGGGFEAVGRSNTLSRTVYSEFNAIQGYWADYDNDGYLDLFLPIGFAGLKERNLLFRNLGGRDFAIEPTLSVTHESTSARWGDFDRDGRLDLVLDTSAWPPGSANNLAIYKGNTAGGFALWKPTGLADAGQKDWFTGSVVGDFNADGFQDIAVWNGPTSLRTLQNRSGTNFVLGDFSLTPESGQNLGGVSAADFDNDGDLDLFHGHTWPGIGQNTLLQNDGKGGFVSVPLPSALRETKSHTSSWGDYDNDGYLDLFSHDGLWHNQGDGTFARVQGGSLASETRILLASVSWGDFDNDGFLDLVSSTPPTDPSSQVWMKDRLFHNNGNGNGWLLLKLVGTKSNRSAIGAKIRLKANLRGKDVLQYREIGTGNCFGQNDLRAHFGLADAAQAESIEIEWPSGTKQTLNNVAGKQILTITEPSDQPRLSFGAAKTLQLVGVPQAAYWIESSEDLQTWSDRPDLAVKIDDSGKATISILDGASGSVPAKAFFRVRVP